MTPDKSKRKPIYKGGEKAPVTMISKDDIGKFKANKWGFYDMIGNSMVSSFTRTFGTDLHLPSLHWT